MIKSPSHLLTLVRSCWTNLWKAKPRAFKSWTVVYYNLGFCPDRLLVPSLRSPIPLHQMRWRRTSSLKDFQYEHSVSNPASMC